MTPENSFIHHEQYIYVFNIVSLEGSALSSDETRKRAKRLDQLHWKNWGIQTIKLIRPTVFQNI